ncbi:HPP family protein [Shewanella sedimentimangrovi]|uniref:HPP family protein n=1 Tax=Shewanella sedimentimangrovi TaxID=2814293 RepID=A0ABX7R4U9_9GAMM|nr:HPP family protein [Shewanella sedimentimangrovi]QSX37806.1 HPP family protein [Shewanella sedimentimangrovi]
MKPIVYPLLAGVGAAVAIGLLSLSTMINPNWVLLMAPFGATAVLVFGVPDSPLAQPKNVILGHLLTAFIGLCFLEFVGISPLSLALASGLAVSLMLLTKTTHPPAGANPLLVMLTSQHWDFLFTTVLAGSLAMVALAQMHRSLQRRWV